jgi:hypothetical protein
MRKGKDKGQEKGQDKGKDKGQDKPKPPPPRVVRGSCGTCGQAIWWTVYTDSDGKVTEDDKTCRFGHRNL